MRSVKTKQEFIMLAQQYALNTNRPAVADYIRIMSSWNEIRNNSGLVGAALDRDTIQQDFNDFMSRFGYVMTEQLKGEYEFSPEALPENLIDPTEGYYAPSYPGYYTFLKAAIYSEAPLATADDRERLCEQFKLHENDDPTMLGYTYYAGSYANNVNERGMQRLMSEPARAAYDALPKDQITWGRYGSEMQQAIQPIIEGSSAFSNDSRISASLNIMPELLGIDLDLLNYNDQLKKPEYKQWADNVFDDMFITMYSNADINKMKERGVSPMHFVSIDGKPLTEYIRTSPLYDPSKSFEEQAKCCALGAILDGDHSVEVRRFDAFKNELTAPEQIKVKTDIKEPFSLKKFFSRLFSFITGEKSKEERLASIGKGEMHNDTPEDKAAYIRQAAPSAEHSTSVTREQASFNELQGNQAQRINTPISRENTPQAEAEHTI